MTAKKQITQGTKPSVENDEGYYRGLFYGARDAMLVMQGERFIECNPQTELLFGCSQEEILGKTPFDFSPARQPDGQRSKRSGRHWLERASSGEVQHFEWTHIRADGAPFFAEVSLARLGESPESHVLAIVRDISNHKLAEKIIGQERDRAELYLDVANVIIVALDHRGHIMLVNRRGCEILGYEEYELLGQEWFGTCVPEAYQEKDRQAFQDVLEGAIHPIENSTKHIRNKAGSERLIAWHNHYLRDEDGRMTGSLSSGEDITEREAAGAAQALFGQHLTTIHEIDLAILAARSFSEIAESVVRQIGKSIPCDHAVVATVTESDTLQFKFLAAQPVLGSFTPGSIFALPKVDSLLFPGVREQGNLVIHDLQSVPTRNPFIDQLLESGMRSAALISLIGSDEIIGILGLVSEKTAAFSDEDVEIASRIASTLSVALQNAELINNLQAQSDQQRAMATRLTELHEEERAAIAAELHDRIGQNLTAASIHLNVVRNTLPQSDDALLSRLEEMQTLLEQTTADIRDVMSELRPSVLDDYGLIAALRWYVEKTERMGEVTIELIVEGDDAALSAPVSTALFRICQEAVTNILRYAQVKRFRITFKEDADLIGVCIEDDGIGFDTNQAQVGLGITIMHERALSIGAQFEIKSTPGEGTAVCVTVYKDHG